MTVIGGTIGAAMAVRLDNRPRVPASAIEANAAAFLARIEPGRHGVCADCNIAIADNGACGCVDSRDTSDALAMIAATLPASARALIR